MILEPVPIRTPCCQRLAMRTVMTVIHLGDGISANVSAHLARQTRCPHCGGTIARDEGQRIRGFHGRMQRYIFAGVPELQAIGFTAPACR